MAKYRYFKLISNSGLLKLNKVFLEPVSGTLQACKFSEAITKLQRLNTKS